MSGQTTCQKIIRDVHLWGQKHQIIITKQQQNNHNFECLYFMFANHHMCVVLRSNVRHIDGWNCP